MNVSTKLLVQISANSAQFIAGMNQANKSLSLFQKSVVSLKNTLAGTFGAYAVINGIQEAINKLAEFDKVMTQVSVITGSDKTSEGFKRLEQSALSLGSSTQYTAKQIAELQLEFGRLGFSTREILQSTKATVDLATATGEGLARSAEIAGSTLRAFGLDASEMGRVTDVMAAALNNSALTLDSFADGIKYVSPVAAAVNVSLEETAAMMSVLADAGIKGTQAGTSLRRIFTMLTDKGKPLQDRLDDLAKSGLSLAGANDEVGLYAQTALLILTKYKPKIDELTIAYNDAIGQTDKMARAMEDNLATSLTKVGTAYDSLILSFRNSKGVLKDTADGLADILRGLATDQGKGLLTATALVSPASLIGLVANMGKLGKAAEVAAVNTERLKSENDQLIDDSASVLLRDYGDDLYSVKQELIGNANETAIYTRYLDLLKTSVENQAKAIVDATNAQLENNKAKEEALKLALEEAQIQTDKRVREFDAKYAPPTGMEGFKQSAQVNPSLPNDPYAGMAASLASINDLIDENNKKQAANRENIIATRMEYAMMADQIGDSVTRVIAGEYSMADAFRVVTAEILDEIQKRIIANIAEGSSKLFALNPLLGIAAVTAGFAITKGLLKRIGNSSSSSNRINGGIEVYGKFEMSGRTAVALVRSGERSNSITGG